MLERPSCRVDSRRDSRAHPPRPSPRVAARFLPLAAALLLLSSSCGQGPGQAGGTATGWRAAFRNTAEGMPRVVPVLDSLPSAADGRGEAVLSPAGPLPAGSAADFEIRFTVGEPGIAAGGFVLLQVSPWWGWSPPQTAFPGQPGYTEVSTSDDDPSLRVAALPVNRVLVSSGQRGWRPGETLTFRYGGGARVDRYAEAEELFQLFVDGDGDGHSACIENPPALRLEAGPATRLAVNAPSIVTPGTRCEVTVAALDGLDNWSRFPAGDYRLEPTREGRSRQDASTQTAGAETRKPHAQAEPDPAPSQTASGGSTREPGQGVEADPASSQTAPGGKTREPGQRVEGDPASSQTASNERTRQPREPTEADPASLQSAAGGEKQLVFSFVPPAEGVYFLQVQGPGGLSGRSNVILCRQGRPALTLSFGDIHGHSRLSDGTGTPEDFYRYARQVSGLDLAALTDHADYGTIPVKGKVWERIGAAADRACEPGRFVTFLGFEWTSWQYGHRNVYYRDADGPVFRSIDPESDTPQELWQLLEGHEAMTVAHHVGGGPKSTDWSIPPWPREWLVEISSVHGSSEAFGAEACIYSPVRGAFVRDALSRGYRLGIIGSGDTHDGHPGGRSIGARVSGLVGVYSRGRTREEIWEAFRQRRVYGTSGPKIILNFQVADSPMGSEVSWDSSRGPIPIAVRAVGCAPVEKVEIVRDGEPTFRRKAGGILVQAAWEDQSLQPGTHWYYARVLQEDGNLAWSSPVWVTVE